MKRVSAYFMAVIMALLWFPPALAQDTTGKKDIPPAVPIQAFDPSRQKPVSYVDEKIRAELVRGPEVGRVKLTELSTGKEQLVELPTEMAQVDAIDKGVDGKLVVRGMVNGSTSEVAVIDLGAARVIDRFLCYLPAISYDGRYIAFIKFYPAHFAEGVEDHYMLYDLAIGPQQNRPSGARGDDWTNVGRCIYPPGVGNAESDNVGRPRETVHYSKSRLFWSPNREQLFFADESNSNSQVTLVLADIAANENVSVRVLTQDAGQFCSPSSTGAARCSVLIRNAHFQVAEGGIAVMFETIPSGQQHEIEYKSAQFR